MALRKLRKTTAKPVPEMSDEAFDARVAESVVSLWNDRRPYSDEVFNEIFGWLPAELNRRAKAAGVPPQQWTPSVGKTAQKVARFRFALILLMRGFASLKMPGNVTLTANGEIDVFDAQEWVETVLAGLPIYQRFSIRDGALVRRSVPLLTDPGRCLAYTYALLLDPNSPLNGRLKTCADTRNGEHLFLAIGSRVDRQYCCPKHQNANAQSRHRERLAAEVAK